MSEQRSPFTLGQQLGVTDLYLRRWSLMLASSGAPGQTAAGGQSAAGQPTAQIAAGSGFELSSEQSASPDGLQRGGLRIHFTIKQANANTPNTAEITVYNLADQTAADLIDEFDYVVLQAGYQFGNFGVIFAGQIKQYKKGHENVTDSYLTIYAADGDQAINNATVNQTAPEGTTADQKWQAMQQAMGQHGVQPGYTDKNAVIYTPHIRPEVMYGMAADEMRDYAASPPGGKGGAVWSVDNGVLNLRGSMSYEPGETVTLTGETGLIGWPEMTQDGIEVTALINPAIRLGGRIWLDNSQINQYFTPGGGSGAPTGVSIGASQINYWYPTNRDGIYSPQVIEFEGDSYGMPWYMKMTCLAVDPSADLLSAMRGGQDIGSASVG